MLHRKFIPVFVALTCLGQQAQAAQLGSYRAFYELQPVRLDQGLKVQPVDGRLSYEVTGSACAGWNVSSRLLNRTAEQEQGMKVSEIKSVSHESADGLDMTVSQQEMVNDKLADDAQVKVRKLAADKEARGSISGSKSLTFNLAPDVIYPTQHQMRLLDAAVAGKTRDVSTVYDGSDGAKQFRIITFIGKKRPPQAQTQPGLDALSTMASWSFQLGYYPVDDSQADAPEFQATFNMYENGVSTEMLFDYGSYAMKAKITQLENLDSLPCTKAVDAPQ